MDEYRALLVKPIELLADPDKYAREIQSNSVLFMKLNDLLAYMEKNIARYPKMKAFLWTLESRGFKGCSFGVAKPHELEEQTKLINMFLNFQYWDARTQ
jgi:hypothetical protein